MEYHNWQTLIDEYSKSGLAPKGSSTEQVFQDEMKNLLRFPFMNESNRVKRMMRLNAEYVWILDKRPYYKIHPYMVRQLAKTNLDKIPANLIELPDFKTILFRFCEPVPIRYTHSGVTMLADPDVKDSPIYARSVLISRLKSNELKETYETLPAHVKASITDVPVGDEDMFFLSIDEGFRLKDESGENSVERMLCNSLTITARASETIPQAISRAINEASDTESLMMLTMKERLENLFRIIIATGFLANTPEDNLVVPDIINKDKIAYKNAVEKGDTDRIGVIVNRAKNRGHNGWNVGTNEMFVGEIDPQPGKEYGEGRALTYSHIRGGHPHAVRFGPGKTKVKIKWFRPTRIRKDLPFKDGDK